MTLFSARLRAFFADGLWPATRETFIAWFEDSAPRWSAAIAFYTLFSLAPVLVIVTAVAGALWGDAAVRGEVVAQFRALLGAEGAGQVERLIAAALPQRAGSAAVAGIVTLVLGATAVFTTLQSALNAVWGLEEEARSGIWATIRARLLSFALVLVIGFLLAASLLLSAALAGMARWMRELLPVPIPLLRVVDVTVSLLVLWLLFALIFKWLPDARIAWKDVWIGAAATSLLFSAGKYAIGFYLGHGSVASTYGVAASVVLLLLWVYYSAMIFLLGAEFTQMYARRWGSMIRPWRAPADRPPPRDGFSAPQHKGETPRLPA